ncbi:hypothetical protein GCM10009111_17850 [Colwellia asteriadis]|uniref:Uncharacterized protein n=1 Tax=Colwellia asteriadis TaxID=517723 RepID=A0ABN1L6U6_9GAMM
MKIAELRQNPFILLVLKDGVTNGDFSAEFMHKTQQQLSDMSLRIASDYLSIIYADQIKKACEIVLGMINLGLLSQCNNDSDKAIEIIKNQGIVFCFRAGWAKYAELKSIAPEYFKEIPISTYALGVNDTADIMLKHTTLVKNAYKSIKLLEVHKQVSAKYSANTVIPEHDEDVLLFELQKFLNSALGLLLINSDRNVFNSDLYNQLVTYLSTTPAEQIAAQLSSCTKTLISSLPLTAKMYLEEVTLFEFSELKKVIASPKTVAIYLPEVLELSVNVTNELHDDFDGGYDFGIDDIDDDIAYLKPNSE